MFARVLVVVSTCFCPAWRAQHVTSRPGEGPAIQQSLEQTGRPTRVEMQGITELVHKPPAGEQADEDRMDWARGVQEVVSDGEEAVVPVWMANGMRRIPRRIV